MVETEIKLAWRGSIADARAHLENHGYKTCTPRALERDQFFDRPSGELTQSGQVLRLRRPAAGDDTQAIVTFKGPAMNKVHKSREEIEFAVSDSRAFCLVLERLGYQPGFRYEKYRTVFRAAGEPGLITLDETSMGIFMELEGPGYWIDVTAARLGFLPADYITASYPRLYQEYRDQNPMVSPEMTSVPGHGNQAETKES